MGFAFAFEAVLRLRRSQQRQQELLLQKANEEVNAALREVRTIAQQFAQIASSFRLDSDLRASELHFNQMLCRALEERRQKGEERLAKFRGEQAALAAELRKVWRQREVLEALRRRHYQTYLLEQSRREQRTQDDVFLSHQRYLRNTN